MICALRAGVMLKIEAIQTGLQVPVPKAWSLDSAEASPNEIAEIERLAGGLQFSACARARLGSFRPRPGHNLHLRHDS